MAGFSLDPNVLAQLASSGFRPPQVPTMPGFNLSPQLMPQQQGGGGPGMGDGMALMGMGLKALGGMGGGAMGPETGAVGPGGLAGAVSGIDALKPGADGVWQQPAMPTDIGSGQGGGIDPLTGLVNWIGRQFRPGGV